MQDTRKCPECSEAMSTGAACVRSYAGGLTWHEAPSTLALHGKTLVSGPLGGTIWLEGFRCPKCHLLMVHYPKKAKTI